MRDHGGDFGIVAGSCLSYTKVRSSRHSMELVGVVGRWGLGIGDRVGVGRCVLGVGTEDAACRTVAPGNWVIRFLGS